jgi:membrane fusion protein, multidrug efflux system
MKMLLNELIMSEQLFEILLPVTLKPGYTFNIEHLFFMRNKPLLIVLLIVILLLAIKFIFLKGNKTATAPTGSASKNAPVMVNAIVTKAERIGNEVYSSGTVLANEEVELRPEIAGKILSVNFKEGSRVNKGTLLVKINDADLQAQLKKLQVQIKLATEQEQRAKKLLDISGVSREEYDISLNQVNALKADEEFTRAQIAKTELRAPFNGVIGLKNVSEGSYVSPNQTIAWMQQVDPVKIDFSIPEKYASMVAENTKIKFTVASSNESFTGTVYAVQPRIDVGTRSLQVRALSLNKEGKIIPGSFVKIQLTLKEYENAFMVPTQAIVPVLKGKTVFVARNGKAESQKVETGIRTDTTVQVLEGLKEGDTVVTTGLMQLRAGMPIRIISAK